MEPPHGAQDSSSSPINRVSTQNIGERTIDAASEEPKIIGFVAVPIDMEELMLLIETDHELPLAPNSALNVSKHEEKTTDSGETIHCGIEVDGIAILVRCPARIELCTVYNAATA